MIIAEFGDMIPIEYLPSVTLNARETGLELFGDENNFVVKKLEKCTRRFMKEHGEEFNPDPFESFKVLEHYSRLGAYLGSRNGFRKVWEIGCGSAIPSIAYAILTGNEITAVDVNKSYLQEAFDLKETFGLKNLEIVCDDGIRLIEQGHITSEDRVLFSNPIEDFFPFSNGSTILSKLPKQVVYSGYLDVLIGENPANLQNDSLSFSYRVNNFLRGEYPTDMWVLDLERI